MPLFPETRLLIDGELCPAEGGATYADVSPWTGQEIGRAADASPRDLDSAIAAARRAFDENEWSRDHQARLVSLRRFADCIKAGRDRLALLARHETGAAGGAVFGPACDAALGMLDFPLQVAAEFCWDEDLGIADSLGVRSRRQIWKEARGVVAAITPWNMPTQINLAKSIPALAAGCTVVLKAAPDTPMLGAVLGEMAVEAGLPAGVFNVITASSPADIGEALVNDPRIDMISFTGSTAVGKRIMANAADRLARVFLELGGKSAAIILDDVDVPQRAARATMSLFHAGQGCATTTRILVPRSRYEEAVAALKTALENLPYGDFDAPMQIMGPLISQRQRQRVLDYIEIGKQEGAQLVTGGGIPTHLDPNGFFVEPTLFADVTNDMRIAREEIFGPVLVVIAFDDDDDAVRIANDSPYGLSGSVTSASLDRAKSVARRIRTGTLGINGGNFFAGDVPFGGYKQSGIGREMGLAGFEEYLEMKSVGLPID